MSQPKTPEAKTPLESRLADVKRLRKLIRTGRDDEGNTPSYLAGAVLTQAERELGALFADWSELCGDQASAKRKKKGTEEIDAMTNPKPQSLPAPLPDIQELVGVYEEAHEALVLAPPRVRRETAICAVLARYNEMMGWKGSDDAGT